MAPVIQRKVKMVVRILGMGLMLSTVLFGCGREQGRIPEAALTSISPNAGLQEQSVAVTLTGTNFIAGATIGVSGAGITVSGTTVVSATQITATFIIAANAPTGAQNVTVTTLGGTSAAVAFTVDVATPTLNLHQPE